MVKNSTIFLFALILMISCRQQSYQLHRDNEIPVPQEKQIQLQLTKNDGTAPSHHFTDYFKLIKRWQLQSDRPESQMGGFDQIIYDAQSELLLILDAFSPGIFVFDDKGTFRNKIGRVGRGPAEFIYPKDICILPGNRLAVAAATLRKVLIFNYKGAFLDYFELRIQRGDRNFVIRPDCIGYIQGHFFIVSERDQSMKTLVHEFSETGEYLGSFHPITPRNQNGPPISYYPKIYGTTSEQLFIADRFEPNFYMYDTSGTLLHKYWMKPQRPEHRKLIQQLDRRISHLKPGEPRNMPQIRQALTWNSDHFKFLAVHPAFIFAKLPFRYLLFDSSGDCLYDFDLNQYRQGPGGRTVKLPAKVNFPIQGKYLGTWKHGIVFCGFLPHKPGEPPSGIIQVSVYKYTRGS